MKIKIGDKVETLNDIISGVVVKIESEKITIESEDGFTYQFRKEELVKVGDLKLDSRKLKEAIQDKKEGIKTSKNVSKRHDNNKTLRVDLHFQEVIEVSKYAEDYEILSLQLQKAIQKLEFALQNRYKKIIFIHGVGEGVLRHELRQVLSRYEQVSFKDADFKEYGIMGATEVFIYQNL